MAGLLETLSFGWIKPDAPTATQGPRVGATTPAYQNAVSGLRSANEQAALGNQPEAIKALTYVNSQLGSMTQPERVDMMVRIAKTTQVVYRPRTAGEIQTGRDAFQRRVDVQQNEARAETERQRNSNQGGQWWSPDAWVPGATREASSIANKAIVVAAVLGGGYLFVKLLGYMTEAQRTRRVGYALSNNPRRRRRRN